MRGRTAGGALAGAMVMLSMAVLPAEAQRRGVTLEVYAGGADFGTFLESRVGVPAREQEVTFERSVAFGGSLGMNLWEKTSIRAQTTWVQTDVMTQDDTPDGGTALDAEDLADVEILAFGVEVLKYLLDPGRGWSPYGVAGVTFARWSADEGDAAAAFDANGNESLWRAGGMGGLGLELRPGGALTVRLEASTYGLGSPFDGNEAWSMNGVVFDEASAGRMTRLTLGLAWTFGDDGDNRRRRR